MSKIRAIFSRHQSNNPVAQAKRFSFGGECLRPFSFRKRKGDMAASDRPSFLIQADKRPVRDHFCHHLPSLFGRLFLLSAWSLRPFLSNLAPILFLLNPPGLSFSFERKRKGALRMIFKLPLCLELGFDTHGTTGYRRHYFDIQTSQFSKDAPRRCPSLSPAAGHVFSPSSGITASASSSCLHASRALPSACGRH